MTEKIPYVHCPTQEDFDRLMEACEKKGWKRINGDRPTDNKSDWKQYKSETCVDLDPNFGFADKERYEIVLQYGPCLTVDEAIERLEGETKHSEENRKYYTYSTTHTRSDGVVFTEDTIDGKKVKEIENEIKSHRSEAKKLQGLLRSHKVLFPTKE